MSMRLSVLLRGSPLIAWPLLAVAGIFLTSSGAAAEPKEEARAFTVAPWSLESEAHQN